MPLCERNVAVPASFHPVWRDYPISTRDVSESGDGQWPSLVSIPSGGIILFPPVVISVRQTAQRLVSIPSGGIILFPLARYTPNGVQQMEGFHPVWRDYPISTKYRDEVVQDLEAFPSRLAGLSYFHLRFK